MLYKKLNTGQLSLIGVIAFLLILLTWLGLHTNRAKYSKPISEQIKTIGEVDIFKLLHRFSGTNKSINHFIDELEKDTLNLKYINLLDSSGVINKIDVFSAYSNYLKGIKNVDEASLLLSAKLFFEAGTHDPDTLADKTTYSIYSIRACERVLQSNPKNLEALTSKALAIIYFGGAIMKGVGILKQVESIDSNYVDAQHHLMILDLQSGQLKKAEKRIKKLVHLQPENPDYRDILLKLETQQIK